MAAKEVGDGGLHYMKVQFLSSAGASAVSALLLTPLDVIKTRMQTVDSGAATKAPVRGVCSFFPTNYAAKSSVARMGHVPVVDQLCYLCGKELQPAGVPNINPDQWCKRTLSTTVALGRAPLGGKGGKLALHHVVREIVRYEGVGALWKGTGPSLAMAIPQVGIYLTLYDRLKLEIQARGMSLTSSSAMAGAVARAASTTVTSPLELVRTRLQANGAVWGHGVHAECEASARRTSGWVRIASRALTQAGGIAALWQGLGPTLWRDVPFSAIYWLVAEGTRERLMSVSAQQGGDGGFGRPPGGSGVAGGRLLHANMAAGMVGGAIASLCTHPFDVIKTTSQVKAVGERGGHPSSTYAIGKHIVSERGVGYLWRGIVPRLLKVAPSCALVLTSYEALKALLS